MDVVGFRVKILWSSWERSTRSCSSTWTTWWRWKSTASSCCRSKIQPQTLNWGYGTRFFAPDYDVAGPVDLKFFVKNVSPTRRASVVLDVVMNMYGAGVPDSSMCRSPGSNTPSTPGRQDWGQELFLFNTPSYGNYYAAREFLCEMAEFWVDEYHIDGYRIDDFADINNWDFVQEFYLDCATARRASRSSPPSRFG